MIRLIIFYFIAAFLIGFWPFEKSVLEYIPIGSSTLSYDEGYEDGYDGAIMKSEKSPYIDGYYDGDFDAECEWLKYDKKDFEEFKRIGCGAWSDY